jgi:heme/copper-type cytochrome/quinol oxidase subunit 4
MEESQKDTRGLRRGVVVFVGLAILTIVEFGIAIGLSGNIPLLAIVAIAKTLLILEYFMHLSSLFRREEDSH